MYETPYGLPVDVCIFTITSQKKATARKSLPIQELKVLLIKRKIYENKTEEEHPYQGYWAIPGGFSKKDESLYEAAKRELKSEANVGDDVHIEQLEAIYYPNRDPRGWVPTVVYYALVKENELTEMQGDDDASDAKLFSIGEALRMELAFDHRFILEKAYEKVKEKMLYTTIAKEFLEEEFTIAELLQVIQVVCPEFIVQQSNFTRKLLNSKGRENLLEEAKDENGNAKKTDRNSNYPAKMYRFTDLEPKLSIYNSTLY